jgi:hypothetical protein
MVSSDPAKLTVMKRLICFGLSVVFNALLVGALVWPSISIPDGRVFISDLNGVGAQIIASRAHAARSGKGLAY